jgi:hypothetical protein
MIAVLRRAWQEWKRVAAWIGERQAVVIYAVLYAAVIGPVALARRAFTDPLQLRGRRRSSFWRPRAPTPTTLEEARRQ